MAVAPLLAGLYAGDVDRLSARATFPELLMWESTQGSLIRGSQAAMRSVRRGTPTPMFVKPKGGVGRLTDALAASLGDRVVTGAPVGSLSELGERGDASAIVLAVPSFEAGRLLGPRTGRVCRAERHPVRLDRRGVPGLRRRDAGRAAGGDRVRGSARQGPDDGVHVDQQQVARSGVRLARRGPLLRGWRWATRTCSTRQIEDLVDACERHLSAVLDLPARPQASSVVRWMRAMPQYEVGHVERVERIRATLPTGIFVVGSAYDGVGVPDCVRAAGETAEQVLAHLGRTTIEKETAR